MHAMATTHHHPKHHIKRILVAICLTSLSMTGWVNSVSAAAVITVTTTVDESNSDGDCSLREALRAANTDAAVDACAAGSGSDTVVLETSATYTLGTIDNTSDGANGLPSITSTVTIQGGGATITRVVASSIRFFHVASIGNLTLNDVTLSGGRIAGGAGGASASGGGGGAAGLGGAIYNRGALITLERVTATSNSCHRRNAGGDGGTQQYWRRRRRRHGPPTAARSHRRRWRDGWRAQCRQRRRIRRRRRQRR